jgi:hypothetical protein
MDDFDDLPTRDDVVSQGKAIRGWRFVQTDADTRVYFNLNESSRPRSGFDFCCIEWAGDDGGEAGGDIPSPATIDSPTCRVRTLFEGRAAFDGIRHLYFVGSGDGYVFCASVPQIVAALNALRALELEHCWDARPARGTGE